MVEADSIWQGEGGGKGGAGERAGLATFPRNGDDIPFGFAFPVLDARTREGARVLLLAASC
jgi:hypothetical protein